MDPLIVISLYCPFFISPASELKGKVDFRAVILDIRTEVYDRYIINPNRSEKYMQILVGTDRGQNEHP